jgi:hypothetical protein
MQSSQCLCSRISGTGVADALEVGFGIEHGNSVVSRQSSVCGEAGVPARLDGR